MKQSEFARLHGVSRKTVTMWKARGWLVMNGENVDAEASNENIKRYRKTVTPPKDKRAEETPSQTAKRLVLELGADMDLDEARRVKENYFAYLAKLEYEEKSGRLLPFEDMLDDVAKEYSRVRTRLSAIAPEHGPRLRQAALSMDDNGFVAALQDIIYEAMNELTIDQRSAKAEV